MDLSECISIVNSLDHPSEYPKSMEVHWKFSTLTNIGIWVSNELGVPIELTGSTTSVLNISSAVSFISISPPEVKLLKLYNVNTLVNSTPDTIVIMKLKVVISDNYLKSAGYEESLLRKDAPVKIHKIEYRFRDVVIDPSEIWNLNESRRMYINSIKSGSSK